MTGLLSFAFTTFSQAQNWKINGNTIVNGDYLGTNNNEPLIFKADGNEGLRIKPIGELRIKNFDDNLYTGLVYVNTNGVLSKLNFSGNNNEVLLGNGNFGNISNVSGWSFAGGIASTTGKLVIGNISSTAKLNVDGNIVANGSISGTTLNVVDIVGVGKEIKISTSLCMKGIDVNTPGSRNELCGMNGDLFIQSEHNNTYNTILNYGNNTKVGIGVIPIEDFHVGVKARFDQDIYTNDIYVNRIKSSDSLIAFGDSSVYIFPTYNQIFGSENTFMKGTGMGRYAYPKGLHSIAIGRRIRADGINSILLGSTEPSISSMLVNSIDNSLMVGFNSDIPTLFISPGEGNGTFGSVGIGTTDIPDDYKLAVKGKIISEEVYVKLYSNGWPDFVFESDYKRMNFEEKEIYLNANKHLPGILSAREINDKGIPTGEVLTGLTQNVEENTLDILELHKMILELKKENEILKKQVLEIEKK